MFGLWWLSLLVLYFKIVFVFIVIPAALDISLGLRDRYKKYLLKIFDFGFERIQQSNVINEAASDIIDHKVEDEEEEEEEEVPRKGSIPPNKSYNTLQMHFQLPDVCEFARSGIECVIEDTVTKRFDVAELPSWNLLTRTNLDYQFISLRLTVIWVVGFFVRYFVFLPVRVTLVVLGMGLLVVSMACLPYIPNKTLKNFMAKWATLFAFRIIARGISAVVNYHNRENMAKGGGICVANHTSPIDAIILSCDRNYALIGQMQGGIMGALQVALLKAQDHIFFERGEMNDRLLVVQRMREHVEDPAKNPILIFPEGTCVNNTSVMMFKKGSFEVGGTIYPVAIKYDPIFGNAFWNSGKEPMLRYIINMVTSWSIVCDVWYLPPVHKDEDESSIDFANRVKRDIATQGGLVDLLWDGALKRAAVPPRLKAQQQEKFAIRLKSE